MCNDLYIEQKTQESENLIIFESYSMFIKYKRTLESFVYNYQNDHWINSIVNNAINKMNKYLNTEFLNFCKACLFFNPNYAKSFDVTTLYQNIHLINPFDMKLKKK